MPDRFFPASSSATMRPSVVVVGTASACVCCFSTCRGKPTQPDANRMAAGNSSLQPPNRGAAVPIAPKQDLGIAASYQAHFAAMHRQRRIRSFVLRAGRTTPAQERALGLLWPAYGIELSETALDLDARFGRSAPRCLEIGFGAGEVIGTLAKNNP